MYLNFKRSLIIYFISVVFAFIFFGPSHNTNDSHTTYSVSNYTDVNNLDVENSNTFIYKDFSGFSKKTEDGKIVVSVSPVIPRSVNGIDYRLSFIEKYLESEFNDKIIKIYPKKQFLVFKSNNSQYIILISKENNQSLNGFIVYP